MVKNGYRSFTVMDVGKHGGCKTKFKAGRYINKTPVGAAKKAFTEHCRTKKIRGVCTLIITVRETTSGSKKNVFSYKLNRKKLKEPIVMQEGTNNQYLIEYESKAKSVDVPVACLKPGQTRGRPKKRTARKNRLTANNVVRVRTKRRRFKVRRTNSNKKNNRRNNSNKNKGFLSSLF